MPTFSLCIPLTIKPPNISSLYFLPIAHCHFHPANKQMSLVLYIPIRPHNQTLSLLQLTSIPFELYDQICQLRIDHETVIMIDHRPLAIEKTSPTCQLDKGFCRFHQYSSATMYNMFCITQLLRGAPIHAIMQSCNYQCRPITGNFDTPVVDLGHEHYSVTNPPSRSLVATVKALSPRT